MHANNDPLGVRSASVSGSDAEGRPFEVRQSARPTFFIWPRFDCGHYLSVESMGDSGPLHKISLCGSQATQRWLQANCFFLYCETASEARLSPSREQLERAGVRLAGRIECLSSIDRYRIIFIRSWLISE